MVQTMHRPLDESTIRFFGDLGRKQHHTICPVTLVINFDANNLGKISRDHPHRRCQIEVGVGSNGNFQPVFRYISEMVQDREIVTIED